MASVGGIERLLLVFLNVGNIMAFQKVFVRRRYEFLLIIGLNLYIPFSECASAASNLSGGNTPYQQ